MTTTPDRKHVTDGSECWCGPTHETVPAKSAAPYDQDADKTFAPPAAAPRPFPTFAQLAHDLVRYRKAAGNPEVMSMLDNVRFAFDDLIDRVGIDLDDPSPDATIAAHKVHDACQAVIFAIVRRHVP